MTRTLNTTQFQRILKGEDLEFRITQYSLQLSVYSSFEDLTIPYDLNFKDCSFTDLVFRNCKFQGDVNFKECQIRGLKFEGCQFRDVDITGCKVSEVSLLESSEVHKFHIGASSINQLFVERNHIFEAIEVACENNIVNAVIHDNGNSDLNSFKSTIYICPERFDNISLKNNTSEILHVGTIGQYAFFEIDNYNANLVLFSNCNSDSSNVRFQNLQPIDPFKASVCIVNSERIIQLKHSGVFNSFRHIKKYEQQADLRDYSRIAG